MAPPKDIARSYPKRGLTADVGFRSEPKFCGDGSVYFDGSSDYAETAASADLAVGDTFTLTAWVWLNPNPGGASKYALRVGDTGAAAPNIASIGVFGGANPGFYCYNGSGNMSSSVTCDSARWYHVASVIKSGAGNSQIFVDGIDVTNSHSTVFNVTSSSSKIRIGDWNSGGNDWEGYIANACLFTESLTEDQVRQVMRASDYASHAAISTVEAFYPLSANFNDSTGSHNATLTGSASFGVNRPQLPRGLDLARGAAQARVYTGRAVDFDGSADYLLADSSFSGAADFSYSAWVNLDSNSGTRTIVGENSEVTIYLYGNKIGAWNLWGTLGAGEYAEKQATNNAPTNTWVHIGVSYTYSSNTIKLYIDGIDQPTVPSPVIGPGSTSGKIEIGARDNGGSPLQFLDGKIAGVKRFDVALTQDQVRELYHNPEQVLPTGVSASNLRRYYPLSDYNDTGGTGGRYFQDMGADGEPLEDIGSCSMEFAQPVPCPQLGLQQSATRLLFPGGSASHNAVATTAALGTTASVSCWFQANTVSATQVLWAIGNTSGTGFLEAWINSSGTLTIYGQSNITVASVTEGAWTHLVVTTDSGTPPYKVYINGAEISLSGSDTARNFTNGTFEIGNQNTAFPGIPAIFNGIINDIACWNTELSLSDAQTLYNSGVQGMDVSTVQSANLKGWWKCDDLTTLKDYSGNGANATVSGITNAASFPENASGSTIVGDFSMKRKGVSVLNINNDQNYAYALGQDKPSYFPKAGATGYTMSVAHRPIKTGITEIFWGNDNGPSSTPANDQFVLFMNPNGSYQWQLGDGSSRPSAVSAAGIADGDWHILTLTIDYSVSPARWTIYADGIQSTTGTASISGPPGNFYKVSFGRWRSGAYKGSSASGCHRFYDVALSADEVKRLAFSDLRLIKGLNNE